MLVAIGIVLPLLWSKKQIDLKDQKRQRDLEKYERERREIEERCRSAEGSLEGFVDQIMVELNAEELTDFKSSQVLEGGQATLFEAKYRDETVAVKCMFDENLSLGYVEHALKKRSSGAISI